MVSCDVLATWMPRHQNLVAEVGPRFDVMLANLVALLLALWPAYGRPHERRASQHHLLSGAWEWIHYSQEASVCGRGLAEVLQGLEGMSRGSSRIDKHMSP
jgi:hypothetical protein